MSDRASDKSAPSLWLPFALLVIAVGLRAVKSTSWGADWLPNFSPWMALAFAGTALMPRRLAWWWCPVLLIGLDAIVQPGVIAQHLPMMAAVYGAFALASLAGSRFRFGSSLGILGGTLACSLLYYVFMNTLSWAGEPAYAKSLLGWWQAQTVGLPGFPPSWMFLRNALISDAGFAVLLLLAQRGEATARQLPQAQPSMA